MTPSQINPKHQTHIIAVDAKHFEARQHGLCDYTLSAGDLIIARRHELEHTFDYRQVLPQTVFLYRGKVWAYKRTDKGGEAGLHNQISVNVGGHWDLEDIVSVAVDGHQVIDLDASLNKAIQRELAEEITISSQQLSQRHLPKVIAADDTDVDKRHVALVTIVELDGDGVTSNEDEIEALGFISPKTLLAGDYKLETWARMICEMLS